MKLRSDNEIELRWSAPENIDLEIVNAARVSFGKQKTILDEKDIKLINYLISNKHFSPFRHAQLSFRIRVPEFVARQFYRHVIGCHYTSNESTTIDHGWNEISGRYVILEDEFYIPKEFRKQSKNNKQGSSEETLLWEDKELATAEYIAAVRQSYNTYEYLLKLGIAKEIARGILPVSFYTEFIWTASFEAIMNFIKLRNHEHAQLETRELAKDILTIIKDKAPISTEAFLNREKNE